MKMLKLQARRMVKQNRNVLQHRNRYNNKMHENNVKDFCFISCKFLTLCTLCHYKKNYFIL